MSRLFIAFAASLVALLAWSPGARADWDDHPGVDFHPQSTDANPCGNGTPPRGHFSLEVAPASRANGITLTVRQDNNRLCYVSGNVAEAPIIRIRQGQDLVITLRNEITDPDAIDDFVGVSHLDTPNDPVPETAGLYKVVPGQRHKATGATNLHVHGFEVPAIVPQDEVMHTCVDPAPGPAPGPAIRPALCGQRQFTYHYKIPADMPAGLYWYHPHVHGEVQAQMLMGLAGAIVVEGPEDDARRAAGIQDRVFIVRQSQDLDVLAAGQAPVQTQGQTPGQTPGQNPTPPPAATPVTATPPHHPNAPAVPVTGGGASVDTQHELACSDKGGIDAITLNGSKVKDGYAADTELAPVPIAEGTTQLWRFLNAATDAFLDLSLIDAKGTRLPLRVVARDGAPLIDDAGHRLPPTPTTDSLFVPPSGRVEFLIDAPPVGEKRYLVTHTVVTGCAGDQVPGRKLILVTALPTATASTAKIASDYTLPPTPPNHIYEGLLARKTDRERTIALAEYPRPGRDDLTDFYIAELKPGAVFKPFDMMGPPTVVTRAGSTEEWEIQNWTNEIHAFHIHQVHFRVLSVNGKAEVDPPLLDVVNVPFATPTDVTDNQGKVTPGRVRIKIYFPPELAGDILFHCHLTDHEDAGMMGLLRVEPADSGTLSKKAELATGGGGLASLDHPPICRTRRQTQSTRN